MEQSPLFPKDMPTTYRICVEGDIDSDYAERYWGMKLNLKEQTCELEQTALVGKVADQAALVGIINALYNAGYAIVSVERLIPDTDLPKDETKQMR